MTEEDPSAGWYPDTSMTNTLRYWDGSDWSDHVMPAVAPTPFEYVAVALPSRFADEKNITERLNSVAHHGWRLTSTVTVGQHGLAYLIFERPKSSE